MKFSLVLFFVMKKEDLKHIQVAFAFCQVLRNIGVIREELNVFSVRGNGIDKIVSILYEETKNSKSGFEI